VTVDDYPVGCTCGHVFDDHVYDTDAPDHGLCNVCEEQAPTHWIMCKGYTAREVPTHTTVHGTHIRLGYTSGACELCYKASKEDPK